MVFSWEPALWTLMSVDGVWLSKKWKQTKVVQHVPRIIFNVSKVFKFSCFHVFMFSSFQSLQVPSTCLTFRHFFSPLFQGTKYMSLDGEWVSACLDPPVHLRRPLKATCLVVNCSYISGNSSRGIYSCIRLFHKSLPLDSYVIMGIPLEEFIPP